MYIAATTKRIIFVKFFSTLKLYEIIINEIYLMFIESFAFETLL